MERLINWVFPSLFKKDEIYDLAMETTAAIANTFKLYRQGELKIAVENAMFVKMFPNDPNSPSIHWTSDESYIIRYTPHSTPYSHSFIDKCKYVTCLSGKLFVKDSHLKLFKDDKIKVYPRDKFVVYTLEEPCYLSVTIGDCGSTFDRICG